MFKYLPPERIDVLENNLICFNNPDNFNDPFEFHTLFDLSAFDHKLSNDLSSFNLLEKLSDEYKDSLNNLDDNKKEETIRVSEIIAEELYKQNKNEIIESAKEYFIKFNKSFIDTTRVLSLSTDPKNILMWGHYTQSHSGFIIELDEDHDFFHQKRSSSDEYGFLRRVIYQDNIPRIDPLADSPANHFLVKSKNWEYESEWRMLLPVHDSITKITVNNKTFDLFSLPSGAIKTIILGCKSNRQLEDKIVSITTKRKDYSHVKIIKSYCSNERFEIIFKV